MGTPGDASLSALAATLAAVSASSLPGTPVYPGHQLTRITSFYYGRDKMAWTSSALRCKLGAALYLQAFTAARLFE